MRQKIRRLSLEVVGAKGYMSTTSIAMPKELPSVEEENRLKQMLQADKSVRVIAKAMGKTRDCIRKKIARLGLEVVVPVRRKKRTTTSLVLPAELPSVEDALKLFAASSGLIGAVLGILWGRKHDERKALES